MKAFITGGTGFIGSHLVDKLVERGYQVHALVRSQKGAADVEALGATPIWGDITAKESMRAGMTGSDVVFHLAAWYKLGSQDWKNAEMINVDGTRNVLELAYELEVPKIIYTSTVAVYGDTHGQLVDETYPAPEGPFLTEYDRTKWLAHYQIALPLIEKGAPIIILMPGVVYGPGDPSLNGDMMRFFYKGLFPVLPGPELTLTYAHVGDIAEGHILAAEKGTPGESYFLTGPMMNMSEIFRLWAKISGRRAPLLEIPARFIKPLIPLISRIAAVIPLPSIISYDALVILDATYIARSDKAREQLGWKYRPVERGMQETLAWIAYNERHKKGVVVSVPGAATNREIAGLALGIAIGLLIAFMFIRRRK